MTRAAFISILLVFASCRGEDGNDSSRSVVPTASHASVDSAFVAETDRDAVSINASPQKSTSDLKNISERHNERIVSQGSMTVREAQSGDSEIEGISVSFVFSPSQIPIHSGTKVTIVPLDTTLEATSLILEEVTKAKGCDHETMEWRIGTLSHDLADLEIEGPPAGEWYDFVVVSPAASSIEHAPLQADSLPDGFSSSTTIASLDLTGNGKPDVAAFQFCCDKPGIRPNSTGVQCSSCSSAYHIRDEGWHKTWFSGRC